MIVGELGAFLRSRREAVRPEDVGLIAGSRRRTPGLRRAELATLAGVSVDYLIRLEQGRDTNPSAQVLAALADALRLDEADRDRLRLFALVNHSAELCPEVRPPATEVRPTVRAVLDHLEPAPAYVVNHLLDVIAWTDGYDRLARPLGLLDHDRPNLVWFTLTDPRARAWHPDWDAVADEQVARLQDLRSDDEAANAFTARLSAAAGAAFDDRWSGCASPRPAHAVQVIDHPQVGLLRLSSEPLSLGDQDRQQLVVLLPADAASVAGLDRLAGRRPGGLRSVSAG